MLKVFSRKFLAAGQPLPRSILDAGSGAGILGVCAARALLALGAEQAGWDGRVRAQDRDELARVFTLYNAARNGVSPAVLTAHTEPLLAGPSEGGWDLILSNVPAKTGKPVLRDFVSRSAALLSAGGQAMIVVVSPLASFFRSRIAGLGLPLVYEEQSREHTVFIYRRGEHPGEQNPDGEADRLDRAEGASFLQKWPAYLRGSSDYTLEKVPYHIDAFHGVADFDTPGGAVQTAVKLLSNLERRTERRVPSEGAEEPGMSAGGPLTPVLVFEPDQGHFPVWLATTRLAPSRLRGGPAPVGRWVFSGRNILSLEAARYNTLRAGGEAEITLLPAVDPALDQAALAAFGPYRLIALFPETLPQAGGTDRLDAWWATLAALLLPGGFLVVALSASGAERFDRRKPQGFTRLGDVRRMGFRARLYKLIKVTLMPDAVPKPPSQAQEGPPPQGPRTI